MSRQPKDDDEKAFYEFLAKQALQQERGEGRQQQAQEEPGESSLLFLPRYDTDEEIIARTYEELCFDQPRLDALLASKGCRLLAEALSDYSDHEGTAAAGQQQQSYSLSEPFVSGLLEALGRIERSGADTTTAASCSPTGLSILACTVFLKISNIICSRVKTIEEARRLVGSYRGKEFDHSRSSLFQEQGPTERQETGDESRGGGQLGANEGHGAVSNGHGPDPVEGDVSEVWAEESDPSDYCYDSDDGNGDGSICSRDNNAFTNLQQTWMAAIPEANNSSSGGGPRNSEASWKDIALAVTNLLHECNYHQMASLFNDPKKKEIVNIVTQLSLTLLLVTEETTNTNSTISQEFIETYSDSHWQQLALVPVHLLRDAAQHHTSVLPDYVQLLQTLLQVHQHVSGIKMPTAACRIPTAVWLGSSLLSDLCSQTLAKLGQQQPRQQLRQRRLENSDTLSVVRRAIMEASDDLSLLLERACLGNSSTATDDDQLLINALPWSCLSLFQTLSFSQLSSGDAQIVLNSGLFRQWLLLWQQKQEDSAPSPAGAASGPVVLRYIQQSVLDLCVASPALLGKYAWRFPGFAATVVGGNGTETAAAADLAPSIPMTNTADAFLWNLLGIQLSETVAPGGLSTTPAATVQWKKKKPSTNVSTAPEAVKPVHVLLPPPDVQQCRQGALDSYQCLLKNLVSVASHWKQQQEMVPEERHNIELSNELELLTCFGQVVQKLTTTQLLSGLFVSQLLQSPTITRCNCLLNELQQLLVQWPASSKHGPSTTGLKAKTEECDTINSESNQLGNDNEGIRPTSLLEQEQKHKQSYAKIGASIDELRRTVKVLQSLVESSTATSGSQQHHYTSKAD